MDIIEIKEADWYSYEDEEKDQDHIPNYPFSYRIGIGPAVKIKGELFIHPDWLILSTASIIKDWHRMYHSLKYMNLCFFIVFLCYLFRYISNRTWWRDDYNTSWE